MSDSSGTRTRAWKERTLSHRFSTHFGRPCSTIRRPPPGLQPMQAYRQCSVLSPRNQPRWRMSIPPSHLDDAKRSLPCSLPAHRLLQSYAPTNWSAKRSLRAALTSPSPRLASQRGQIDDAKRYGCLCILDKLYQEVCLVCHLPLWSVIRWALPPRHALIANHAHCIYRHYIPPRWLCMSGDTCTGRSRFV